jgi:hypothetical protein
MQETPAAAADPGKPDILQSNISNRAKTVNQCSLPSLLWISTCRAISSEQKLSLASSFPYFSFHSPFILLSSFFLRLVCSGPSHFHFFSQWLEVDGSLLLKCLPTPSRHALSDVVPLPSHNSSTERDIHPSLAPLQHAVAVDAPSLTKHPSSPCIRQRISFPLQKTQSLPSSQTATMLSTRRRQILRI